MSTRDLSIFDYTDYRAFLRDFYAWSKTHKRGFSHRSFLKKAGMSGPSYLKRVMEGHSDLTDSSLPKFQRALELSPHESEFFALLVDFNQATTLEEKDRSFTRLMAIKSAIRTDAPERNQYEYHSSWHHSAIREMLKRTPYQDNPEEFSRMLMPPVQPRRVKKSVEMLRDLKLVTNDGNGGWQAAADPVGMDPVMEHLLLPRLHQSMAELAAGALNRFRDHERHFSGMTISISRDIYLSITEKLAALRDEILTQVQADPCPERVYHLNLQLFPLTSGPRKRGRKKKL